jgi:hypothetical protein
MSLLAPSVPMHPTLERRGYRLQMKWTQRPLLYTRSSHCCASKAIHYSTN